MDLTVANANELGRQLLAWNRQVQSEQGTETACPMCQTPRVSRESGYIRCNQCGVNWLQGENRSKDPRVERYHAVMASARSKSAGNSAAAAD